MLSQRPRLIDSPFAESIDVASRFFQEKKIARSQRSSNLILPFQIPDSRFQTGLRTPGALFSCLEYLQTDVICIHETLNYWVC